MRTELSKFSSLRKSFPHERLFLWTRGFNKLGACFSPVLSSANSLGWGGLREEMSFVWRQGEERQREDKISLSAPCFAGHLLTLLSLFKLIILQAGTVLSHHFNEFQQIRGDSYSYPGDIQLNMMLFLFSNQLHCLLKVCPHRECTNDFILLQFPGRPYVWRIVLKMRLGEFWPLSVFCDE